MRKDEVSLDEILKLAVENPNNLASTILKTLQKCTAFVGHHCLLINIEKIPVTLNLGSIVSKRWLK